MNIYKGDGDYKHIQSGIDRGKRGIPAKLMVGKWKVIAFCPSINTFNVVFYFSEKK